VRRHSVGAWLGRDLERRFTARESRYDSTLMALSLSSKQAVGKQVSMRSLPVTLTRLSLSLSRRSNYHAGNTAVCESTVARSAVIACSTQDRCPSGVRDTTRTASVPLAKLHVQERRAADCSDLARVIAGTPEAVVVAM